MFEFDLTLFDRLLSSFLLLKFWWTSNLAIQKWLITVHQKLKVLSYMWYLSSLPLSVEDAQERIPNGGIPWYHFYCISEELPFTYQTSVTRP